MNSRAQEEKYRRMTETEVYPLLWRMAVPSMIGMMVSSVYSATDTFFIGRLDRTDLTAAVGIVFSFISVIQAVGFWFGYGSGNHVSRLLGGQDTAAADKMTSVGVTLAAAVGAVITAAGLVCIRPLAAVLGGNTSESVMTATVSYLRITLLAVPVMLIANVLYNVLRLQGSARDSMTGLLAGMLLNMALDPVFILLLDMGVAGAALASLIGQSAGALILLMKMGRNGNTAVRLSLAKPSAGHIGRILSGGAPNFCRQGISSVSTVVLNNIAGGFGEPAVAGVTVAMRILGIGYALVIGFGQGFQPVCAINYGAGKTDRVRKGFVYALMTMTAFLIAAAAILALRTEDITRLFSRDEAVCAAACDILRATCVSLPVMGYYILIGMLLQNIGLFGKATLVTVAENGFFLIPLALILPSAFGYDGLVWCKTAAGLCAVIFSAAIGGSSYRKHLRRKEDVL